MLTASYGKLVSPTDNYSFLTINEQESNFDNSKMKFLEGGWSYLYILGKVYIFSDRSFTLPA